MGAVSLLSAYTIGLDSANRGDAGGQRRISIVVFFFNENFEGFW